MKGVKTLSLAGARDETIEIGQEYYFGQIWDGEGDGETLLESNTVSPDNINTIEFVVSRIASDILHSVVRVQDIF